MLLPNADVVKFSKFSASKEHTTYSAAGSSYIIKSSYVVVPGIAEAPAK